MLVNYAPTADGGGIIIIIFIAAACAVRYELSESGVGGSGATYLFD